MEVSSSFFKLTYDHNPRNASIVDCLALKVDEVYGRQIVTTRALRPGDVVAIETPFFKSLDKNSDLRCVNCFKVIGVEQICTCSAFFCSRGCRKVANQDFHQHECSEFRKLTKDDGFSMMVERSILKCLNICGGIEGLQDLINQNPEPTTIFDLNTVAPSQDLNRKLLLACFSLVCAKPNLPHKLGGLVKDFNPDKMRKTLIAEMAIVDPTAGGNPVKLTKKAALEILEAAIAG